MAQKGQVKKREPNLEKIAKTKAANALQLKITRQLPYKRQAAIRILNNHFEKDHSENSIESILKEMDALKYEWDIDKAEWLKK